MLTGRLKFVIPMAVVILVVAGVSLIPEIRLRMNLSRLNSDKSWVRFSAAEALSRTRNRRALEPLIGLLQSDDELEKCYAIQGLENIGDTTAIVPLMSMLKDSDPNVVRHAVKALGTFNDERAIAAVAHCISHPTANVRKQAIISLSQHNDYSVTEPLLPALVDSDIDVRLAAAIALGGRNDIASCTAVVTSFLEAPKPYLLSDREKESWLTAMEQTCSSLPLDTIYAYLGVSDPRIRVQAAWLLGRIGDSRAVPALQRCLIDPASDFAVSQCAMSLAQIGDSSSVDILVQALPDWNNGRAIAEALGELHWQPQSCSDSVHLFLAKREREPLLAHWPCAYNTLLADLKSRDGTRFQLAVFGFLAVGRDDGLAPLLTVLEFSESKYYAEVYLNSGEKRLQDAAKRWAVTHGYNIEQQGGQSPVKWGRF